VYPGWNSFIFDQTIPTITGDSSQITANASVVTVNQPGVYDISYRLSGAVWDQDVTVKIYVGTNPLDSTAVFMPGGVEMDASAAIIRNIGNAAVIALNVESATQATVDLASAFLMVQRLA
jgi:hypothetical protein